MGRRSPYTATLSDWELAELDDMIRRNRTDAEIARAYDISERTISRRRRAMGEPWTAEEDRVVRENYPAHGPKWKGWKHVLPGRSAYSIQQRAYRVGAYRRPRKNAGRDPNERRVFELMNRGKTPTQIDRMMDWPLGAARTIASEAWAADKTMGDATT